MHTSSNISLSINLSSTSNDNQVLSSKTNTAGLHSFGKIKYRKNKSKPDKHHWYAYLWQSQNSVVVRMIHNASYQKEKHHATSIHSFQYSMHQSN